MQKTPTKLKFNLILMKQNGTWVLTNGKADEKELPTLRNPGKPNARYDYYQNGKLKSSRFTDPNGVPSKSIHYTNLVLYNKAKQLYEDGKPFVPTMDDFMGGLFFYSEMQFYYNGIRYGVIFGKELTIHFYEWNVMEEGYQIYKTKEEFIANANIKGTLFRDFIRIIQEAQPKVFVYENVCGMISHDKGLTFEIIQNTFKEISYHFKHYVLDAKNYGIPQSRKRLFIAGFREKKWYDCFTLPAAEPLIFKRSDLLLDKARYGGVTSQNGMLKVDEKVGGGGIDERCFLSQKLIDYVTSPGTKGFYHPNVKIERDIALPSSM